MTHREHQHDHFFTTHWLTEEKVDSDTSEGYHWTEAMPQGTYIFLVRRYNISLLSKLLQQIDETSNWSHYIGRTVCLVSPRAWPRALRQ